MGNQISLYSRQTISGHGAPTCQTVLQNNSKAIKKQVARFNG